MEPDTARMRQILEDGKDPVTAEPLYVLLSLAGHADAHEKCRVLARQAQAAKRPLAEIVSQDATLEPYFKNLTPAQKAVLDDPARYLGVAVERTRAVCAEWEKRLDAVIS